MQIWSKIRRNIWHISRILNQICIKKFPKAESPVMKEVIKHALRRKLTEKSYQRMKNMNLMKKKKIQEKQVRLDVFKSALMNDAVYNFRPYKDHSLTYAGAVSLKGIAVGLYRQGYYF